MTHEEIMQLISTDKELQEKVNVSFFTTENFNKFLDTEEGKKAIQPKMDSYFSKGLDTWKTNNLQKIVDEAIAKANPTETPDQKAIRELREQLNQVQHEKNMEALKLKAIAETNALGLPVELVDFVVTESEESTLQRIQGIKGLFDTEVAKGVETKLKTSATTPQSLQTQQGDASVTKEQFAQMSYMQQLDLFNTNKELFDQLTTGE